MCTYLHIHVIVRPPSSLKSDKRVNIVFHLRMGNSWIMREVKAVPLYPALFWSCSVSQVAHDLFNKERHDSPQLTCRTMWEGHRIRRQKDSYMLKLSLSCRPCLWFDCVRRDHVPPFFLKPPLCIRQETVCWLWRDDRKCEHMSWTVAWLWQTPCCIKTDVCVILNAVSCSSVSLLRYSSPPGTSLNTRRIFGDVNAV